ncbi:MAG: RsmB/NOP family class I SAM-dependent RNA methyltransferase [Burkholderiales bacterium]|nr:RsmB/NOP family class I SAM-dependent RNA methyltransferase [Burkholderiales bacterium]
MREDGRKPQRKPSSGTRSSSGLKRTSRGRQDSRNRQDFRSSTDRAVAGERTFKKVAPKEKYDIRTPSGARITKLVTAELGKALSKILKLDGPADVLMSLYFRDARHLGPRERSLIAEAIYFTMRNLSMITWRLDPIRPDRAPLLTGLLALAMQHGLESIPDQILGSEKDTVLRALKKKKTDAPKQIQAEIPEWLYERTVTQYTDHNALYTALRESAPLDLRVNSMKATPEEVIEDLTTHKVNAYRGEYSPDLVRLDTKPGITQWDIYKDGKIEVQDEGSQLIARLVQPKRGEMICDMCAGAGGKTLALGALMKSSGRIYAFDVNEKRLGGLKPRMRRAGLSNIYPAVIRNENDNHIKRLSSKMDRVLIDAPCSGTGTYRRNPDLKWRFGEDELERINEIQKNVLRSGARMLKPGGRIVYATCSILKQENQDVIEEFLEENNDFELVDAYEVLEKQGIKFPDYHRKRFGKFFVMLPHLNGTDGFFGADLQKKKPERRKTEHARVRHEFLPTVVQGELLPTVVESEQKPADDSVVQPDTENQNLSDSPTQEASVEEPPKETGTQQI